MYLDKVHAHSMSMLVNLDLCTCNIIRYTCTKLLYG